MTPRELCASCGAINRGIAHDCPAAKRVRAGVGPQLAMLRARVAQLEEQLADAQALLATMQPAPEASR